MNSCQVGAGPASHPSIHPLWHGLAARRHFSDLFDQALTWEFLPWLKANTRLPVLLKARGATSCRMQAGRQHRGRDVRRAPGLRAAGPLRPALNPPYCPEPSPQQCPNPPSHHQTSAQGILSPDDARKAVELGADGIIISNHGGRQLNYAPAAVDMLPAIAGAATGCCLECWGMDGCVAVAAKASARFPPIPLCRSSTGQSAAAGRWWHHARHRWERLLLESFLLTVVPPPCCRLLRQLSACTRRVECAVPTRPSRSCFPADVIKCLALGASAVLVGRPLLWVSRSIHPTCSVPTSSAAFERQLSLQPGLPGHVHRVLRASC